MNRVHILHNPGAGDEEFSKEKLVALIEENGFECRYSSTKKKGWENFEKDIDFIVIAGGDGTIRDVTGELLNRKTLAKKWPLALLPLGTANNIAKTLGINGKPKDIIRSWHKTKIKKFDVGRLYDIKDSKFFLESFGYGIFPYLMKEMKKLNSEKGETAGEELQVALKMMHQFILSYEPRYCKLKVDGTDHSGKFLLAEIMNTRTIGPNLCLSPLADPGDGELEVVLVPEKHKEKFASFVKNKLNGTEETYLFHTLKAKEVQISWQGTHVHVDDETIKIEESAEVKIEMMEGLLNFLVPE